MSGLYRTESAHLNGPFALTKRRHRVMIGILARELMRGSQSLRGDVVWSERLAHSGERTRFGTTPTSQHPRTIDEGTDDRKAFGIAGSQCGARDAAGVSRPQPGDCPRGGASADAPGRGARGREGVARP